MLEAVILFAMSTLNVELYDALREANVSEGKARAAAASIPFTDQFATKKDISDVRESISDVRESISELRESISELKATLVMLLLGATGVILAAIAIAVAIITQSY